LAEVDFPIADVSKHSAREKSIRAEYPIFARQRLATVLLLRVNA
jgi:adenine-specific DNA methylase